MARLGPGLNAGGTVATLLVAGRHLEARHADLTVLALCLEALLASDDLAADLGQRHLLGAVVLLELHVSLVHAL